MSINEVAEKNSKSVSYVIDNFVIGNVILQTNEDVFKKGSVAIPYLEGPPGIGKTAIISEKIKDLNWSLLTIQPALKPIEEYGGIPRFRYIQIDGEKILATEWSIPDILVELHKRSKEYDIVVFFWDDIHLCGPEHLALMQECFTERSIRGYRLPANVGIVLAGNDSNKAGYRSLSSAIINRCVKLPVHPSFEEWKNDFAIKNDVHPGIVSFLGNTMYTKYFQEEEQIDAPWASVRQWTRLSNFVTEYEKTMGTMSPDSLLYYATGSVGNEAASQFAKYYEIFSKFDLEKIFKESKNFRLPEDVIDRYALIFAVNNYFINNYSKNTKKLLTESFVNIVNKYLEEEPALALLLLKEIVLIDKKSIKMKSKLDVLELLQMLESKNPGLITKVLDKRENDE